MKEIIPMLLGGLVLFIFAVTQLSALLTDVFSDKARDIIGRYTKNLFLSLLVGIALTILLNSSSVVIILTIVLINAGTINFKQSIGIIMGANIGTTFSSRIIAFGVEDYSIIPLIVGLVIIFFAKNKKYDRIGKSVFFLGLIFFGLFLISHSVKPLQSSTQFQDWMLSINANYLKGTLVGGLITLIIQSSGGTVAMAILLGKQKLITLSSGMAIMLGAELGTCSDTLLATIKGSRQSLKAALFHFIFNSITIVLGLLLFHPFVSLITKLFSASEIGVQIANAHIIFNVFGVICFLPFAYLLMSLLNQILPDK